jgi:uncharacterized protein (TIGR02145 family)
MGADTATIPSLRQAPDVSGYCILSLKIINMKKLLAFIISLLSICFVKGQSSVKICDQTWMTKNLDVSTYRNGDTIPQVTKDDDWVRLKTGAWCWYNNDSATNAATYGKLYNWYAVNDSRGLTPLGWHIPTKEEWSTLTTCLGNALVVPNKMKETGTIHWSNSNFATNSSGFTALPGGKRNGEILGYFSEIGTDSYFWSSTEKLDQGYDYLIDGQFGYSALDTRAKKSGFSVRCIKD